MSSTIFVQPLGGRKWKELGQRWLTQQAEKVGHILRSDERGTTAGVARLYFPNGDIEYICMSCLGVMCRVQKPEDAVLPQRNHTCASQESQLDLRKVM